MSAATAEAASGSTRDTVVDILVQTAGMLEDLTPEQWEAPSLCAGWRVADVASHIVWRVGTSTPGMLRDMLGSAVRNGPGNTMDLLSLSLSDAPRSDIVARLRHIAAAKLAGEGRGGTGELTECLVHAYDMANPLGVSLAIDPAVTERVARGGLLLASAHEKVVVRARTLRAVDAGWQLGRGPVIEGTAEAIVLYVFGRRAVSAG